MALPCGKRSITLIWGLLECLFFSGLLNGWIWMQQILTEDGYFLEYCNISSVNTVDGDIAFSIADIEAGIYNPLTTKSHRGTPKCITRRVLKVIPRKDYKLYLTTISTPEIQNINYQPVAKPLQPINQTGYFCNEQSDQLELVISLVIIIRNILMLPLGIFLDKYGTSRTRLLAMSCSALGSLTMLFTSEAYPWLIFPALLMLGVSGILVLLTDLQISNMFGLKRYTMMSMFVGSYFSGGIVIFLMKLTKYTGVNLQTSFMFITIGIVPILISTIAMLPRSRIPWPMPAGYNKGSGREDADKPNSKAKAWQRRISVGAKRRTDSSCVSKCLRTPLYILMVVWFTIISLKSIVYDVNLDLLLAQRQIEDVEHNMAMYAGILLLSIVVAPFIGLVMDCTMCSGREPHVQQMCNILYAVCITFTISMLASVTSLIQGFQVHLITFVLLMAEKVSLHATLFAFLTHVHFPSEYFGTLVGVAISVSGVVCILQYPIKMLMYHTLKNDVFYVNLGLMALLLIAAGHPINLWLNCKAGTISDTSATSEPNKSVTIMLMEKDEEDQCLTRNQGTEKKDFAGLQITDL